MKPVITAKRPTKEQLAALTKEYFKSQAQIISMQDIIRKNKEKEAHEFLTKRGLNPAAYNDPVNMMELFQYFDELAKRPDRKFK